MQQRVEIGGVFLDQVSATDAKMRLAEFAASNQPHQVITANVDFIRQAWASPEFNHLINTADMVVADGMPLVWLSRLTRQPLPERVTGMQLFESCCELAVEHQYSIFLLGAAPRVAERTAILLKIRYPGLHIAGTYSPPMGDFTPEEEAKIVHMIKEAKPTMLMVAFGCPKQDRFIRKIMHITGVPISIGIGGIFNFIAGGKRRAPLWMQQCGLEWLHRLVQEPTRLWERYVVHDLPVLLMLLVGMLLNMQLRLSSAPAPEPTPISTLTLMKREAPGDAITYEKSVA